LSLGSPFLTFNTVDFFGRGLLPAPWSPLPAGAGWPAGIRRAMTFPVHSPAGQSPRQVTLFRGAFVVTTWPHFGHFPRTSTATAHPPYQPLNSDPFSCYTRPMAETRAIRLRRLATAYQRSREVFTDDARSFHGEVRQAEQEGRSVRWIAHQIGMSVAHTHRIMTGLTGPDKV